MAEKRRPFLRMNGQYGPISDGAGRLDKVFEVGTKDGQQVGLLKDGQVGTVHYAVSSDEMERITAGIVDEARRVRQRIEELVPARRIKLVD